MASNYIGPDRFGREQYTNPSAPNKRFTTAKSKSAPQKTNRNLKQQQPVHYDGKSYYYDLDKLDKLDNNINDSIELPGGKKLPGGASNTARSRIPGGAATNQGATATNQSAAAKITTANTQQQPSQAKAQPKAYQTPNPVFIGMGTLHRSDSARLELEKNGGGDGNAVNNMNKQQSSTHGATAGGEQQQPGNLQVKGILKKNPKRKPAAKPVVVKGSDKYVQRLAAMRAEKQKESEMEEQRKIALAKKSANINTVLTARRSAASDAKTTHTTNFLLPKIQHASTSIQQESVGMPQTTGRVGVGSTTASHRAQQEQGSKVADPMSASPQPQDDSYMVSLIGEEVDKLSAIVGEATASARFSKILEEVVQYEVLTPIPSEQPSETEQQQHQHWSSRNHGRDGAQQQRTTRDRSRTPSDRSDHTSETSSTSRTSSASSSRSGSQSNSQIPSPSTSNTTSRSPSRSPSPDGGGMRSKTTAVSTSSSSRASSPQSGVVSTSGRSTPRKVGTSQMQRGVVSGQVGQGGVQRGAQRGGAAPPAAQGVGQNSSSGREDSSKTSGSSSSSSSQRQQRYNTPSTRISSPFPASNTPNVTQSSRKSSRPTSPKVIKSPFPAAADRGGPKASPSPSSKPTTDANFTKASSSSSSSANNTETSGSSSSAAEGSSSSAAESATEGAEGRSSAQQNSSASSAESGTGSSAESSSGEQTDAGGSKRASVSPTSPRSKSASSSSSSSQLNGKVGTTSSSGEQDVQGYSSSASASEGVVSGEGEMSSASGSGEKSSSSGVESGTSSSSSSGDGGGKMSSGSSGTTSSSGAVSTASVGAQGGDDTILSKGDGGSSSSSSSSSTTHTSSSGKISESERLRRLELQRNTERNIELMRRSKTWTSTDEDLAGESDFYGEKTDFRRDMAFQSDFEREESRVSKGTKRPSSAVRVSVVEGFEDIDRDVGAPDDADLKVPKRPSKKRATIGEVVTIDEDSQFPAAVVGPVELQREDDAAKQVQVMDKEKIPERESDIQQQREIKPEEKAQIPVEKLSTLDANLEVQKVLNKVVLKAEREARRRDLEWMSFESVVRYDPNNPWTWKFKEKKLVYGKSEPMPSQSEAPTPASSDYVGSERLYNDELDEFSMREEELVPEYFSETALVTIPECEQDVSVPKEGGPYRSRRREIIKEFIKQDPYVKEANAQIATVATAKDSFSDKTKKSVRIVGPNIDAEKISILKLPREVAYLHSSETVDENCSESGAGAARNKLTSPHGRTSIQTVGQLKDFILSIANLNVSMQQGQYIGSFDLDYLKVKYGEDNFDLLKDLVPKDLDFGLLQMPFARSLVKVFVGVSPRISKVRLERMRESRFSSIGEEVYLTASNHDRIELLKAVPSNDANNVVGPGDQLTHSEWNTTRGINYSINQPIRRRKISDASNSAVNFSDYGFNVNYKGDRFEKREYYTMDFALDKLRDIEEELKYEDEAGKTTKSSFRPLEEAAAEEELISTDVGGESSASNDAMVFSGESSSSSEKEKLNLGDRKTSIGEKNENTLKATSRKRLTTPERNARLASMKSDAETEYFKQNIVKHDFSMYVDKASPNEYPPIRGKFVSQKRKHLRNRDTILRKNFVGEQFHLHGHLGLNDFDYYGDGQSNSYLHGEVVADITMPNAVEIEIDDDETELVFVEDLRSGDCGTALQIENTTVAGASAGVDENKQIALKKSTTNKAIDKKLDKFCINSGEVVYYRFVIESMSDQIARHFGIVFDDNRESRKLKDVSYMKKECIAYQNKCNYGKELDRLMKLIVAEGGYFGSRKMIHRDEYRMLPYYEAFFGLNEEMVKSALMSCCDGDWENIDSDFTGSRIEIRDRLLKLLGPRQLHDSLQFGGQRGVPLRQAAVNSGTSSAVDSCYSGVASTVGGGFGVEEDNYVSSANSSATDYQVSEVDGHAAKTSNMDDQDNSATKQENFANLNAKKLLNQLAEHTGTMHNALYKTPGETLRRIHESHVADVWWSPREALFGESKAAFSARRNLKEINSYGVEICKRWIASQIDRSVEGTGSKFETRMHYLDRYCMIAGHEKLRIKERSFGKNRSISKTFGKCFSCAKSFGSLFYACHKCFQCAQKKLCIDRTGDQWLSWRHDRSSSRGSVRSQMSKGSNSNASSSATTIVLRGQDLDIVAKTSSAPPAIVGNYSNVTSATDIATEPDTIRHSSSANTSSNSSSANDHDESAIAQTSANDEHNDSANDVVMTVAKPKQIIMHKSATAPVFPEGRSSTATPLPGILASTKKRYHPPSTKQVTMRPDSVAETYVYTDGESHDHGSSRLSPVTTCSRVSTPAADEEITDDNDDFQLLCFECAKVSIDCREMLLIDILKAELHSLCIAILEAGCSDSGAGGCGGLVSEAMLFATDENGKTPLMLIIESFEVAPKKSTLVKNFEELSVAAVEKSGSISNQPGIGKEDMIKMAKNSNSIGGSSPFNNKTFSSHVAISHNGECIPVNEVVEVDFRVDVEGSDDGIGGAGGAGGNVVGDKKKRRQVAMKWVDAKVRIVELLLCRLYDVLKVRMLDEMSKLVKPLDKKSAPWDNLEEEEKYFEIAGGNDGPASSVPSWNNINTMGVPANNREPPIRPYSTVLGAVRESKEIASGSVLSPAEATAAANSSTSPVILKESKSLQNFPTQDLLRDDDESKQKYTTSFKVQPGKVQPNTSTTEIIDQSLTDGSSRDWQYHSGYRIPGTLHRNKNTIQDVQVHDEFHDFGIVGQKNFNEHISERFHVSPKDFDVEIQKKYWQETHTKLAEFINKVDLCGNASALIKAVERNQVEVVRILLKHEASADHINPNVQRYSDGRTAMLIAIDLGFVDCVEALLSLTSSKTYLDLNIVRNFEKLPHIRGVTPLIACLTREYSYQKPLAVREEEKPLILGYSAKKGNFDHGVYYTNTIENFHVKTKQIGANRYMGVMGTNEDIIITNKETVKKKAESKAMIKLLVSKQKNPSIGAMNLDETDDYGHTALYYAVHNNDKDILDWLFFGVVDESDESSNSPHRNLKKCTIKDSFGPCTNNSNSNNVLKLNPNIRCKQITTEEAHNLYQADFYKNLISEHSTNDTPLLLAIQQGLRDVVMRYFLDDDYTRMKNSRSSFYNAIAGHHCYVEIAPLNPNLRGIGGDTALIRACKYGYDEIVLGLIKKAGLGCSNSATTKTTKTTKVEGLATTTTTTTTTIDVTEVTAEAQNQSIASAAGPFDSSYNSGNPFDSAHPIDVNMQNDIGETALICAVKNNHYSTVETLLKNCKDLDINVQTYGTTRARGLLSTMNVSMATSNAAFAANGKNGKSGKNKRKNAAKYSSTPSEPKKLSRGKNYYTSTMLGDSNHYAKTTSAALITTAATTRTTTPHYFNDYDSFRPDNKTLSSQENVGEDTALILALERRYYDIAKLLLQANSLNHASDLAVINAMHIAKKEKHTGLHRSSSLIAAAAAAATASSVSTHEGSPDITHQSSATVATTEQRQSNYSLQSQQRISTQMNKARLALAKHQKGSFIKYDVVSVGNATSAIVSKSSDRPDLQRLRMLSKSCIDIGIQNARGMTALHVMCRDNLRELMGMVMEGIRYGITSVVASVANDTSPTTNEVNGDVHSPTTTMQKENPPASTTITTISNLNAGLLMNVELDQNLNAQLSANLVALNSRENLRKQTPLALACAKGNVGVIKEVLIANFVNAGEEMICYDVVQSELNHFGDDGAAAISQSRQSRPTSAIGRVSTSQSVATSRSVSKNSTVGPDSPESPATAVNKKNTSKPLTSTDSRTNIARLFPVDITIVDSLGNTPLILACQSGCSVVVKSLLRIIAAEQSKISTIVDKRLNPATKNQQEFHKRLNPVEKRLEVQRKMRKIVNHQSKITKETALHVACRLGYAHCVKLLLGFQNKELPQDTIRKLDKLLNETQRVNTYVAEYKKKQQQEKAAAAAAAAADATSAVPDYYAGGESEQIQSPGAAAAARRASQLVQKDRLTFAAELEKVAEFQITGSRELIPTRDTSTKGHVPDGGADETLKIQSEENHEVGKIPNEESNLQSKQPGSSNTNNQITNFSNSHIIAASITGGGQQSHAVSSNASPTSPQSQSKPQVLLAVPKFSTHRTKKTPVMQRDGGTTRSAVANRNNRTRNSIAGSPGNFVSPKAAKAMKAAPPTKATTTLPAAAKKRQPSTVSTSPASPKAADGIEVGGDKHDDAHGILQTASNYDDSVIANHQQSLQGGFLNSKKTTAPPTVDKKYHYQAKRLLTLPLVNTKLRNAEGRTALMLAVENGHFEIVGLLLSHEKMVLEYEKKFWDELSLQLQQQRYDFTEVTAATNANDGAPASPSGDGTSRKSMLANSSGPASHAKLQKENIMTAPKPFAYHRFTSFGLNDKDGNTCLTLAATNDSSSVAGREKHYREGSMMKSLLKWLLDVETMYGLEQKWKDSRGEQGNSGNSIKELEQISRAKPNEQMNIAEDAQLDQPRMGIAQLLLEPNFRGDTALKKAVEAGHIDTAKSILGLAGKLADRELELLGGTRDSKDGEDHDAAVVRSAKQTVTLNNLSLVATDFVKLNKRHVLKPTPRPPLKEPWRGAGGGNLVGSLQLSYQQLLSPSDDGANIAGATPRGATPRGATLTPRNRSPSDLNNAGNNANKDFKPNYTLKTSPLLTAEALAKLPKHMRWHMKEQSREVRTHEHRVGLEQEELNKVEAGQNANLPAGATKWSRNEYGVNALMVGSARTKWEDRHNEILKRLEKRRLALDEERKIAMEKLGVKVTEHVTVATGGTKALLDEQRGKEAEMIRALADSEEKELTTAASKLSYEKTVQKYDDAVESQKSFVKYMQQAGKTRHTRKDVTQISELFKPSEIPDEDTVLLQKQAKAQRKQTPTKDSDDDISAKSSKSSSSRESSVRPEEIVNMSDESFDDYMENFYTTMIGPGHTRQGTVPILKMPTEAASRAAARAKRRASRASRASVLHSEGRPSEGRLSEQRVGAERQNKVLRASVEGPSSGPSPDDGITITSGRTSGRQSVETSTARSSTIDDETSQLAVGDTEYNSPSGSSQSRSAPTLPMSPRDHPAAVTEIAQQASSINSPESPLTSPAISKSSGGGDSGSEMDHSSKMVTSGETSNVTSRTASKTESKKSKESDEGSSDTAWDSDAMKKDTGAMSKKDTAVLKKTAASSKESDSDIDWDVDAMKKN